MNYLAPSTDDRRIWDLFLSGQWQSSIVAADDAGVFNALADAPATIAGLAERLDFDVRATGILLRLLTALGLLAQRDGVFQLTDQARLYLVKESPYYWGHMMRARVNEVQCAKLIEKLKDKGSAQAVGPLGQVDKSGREPVDVWAAGEVSLEQARRIAASMHSHSLPAAIGAARNYDYSGIKRILDVGGGSGCFMIAMAQQHPELRCTVMELPTMCEVAQSYIEEGGVADRVETAAVDMFRQAWPKGHDAAFFSNIFHDWNFRTCAWLAERTHEILPVGGRIMLHETLLDDDGAGPVTAASFSMLMLVGTQGQQFTFNELKLLLEQAGFEDVDTVSSAGYYSIVTGYKRKA